MLFREQPHDDRPMTEWKRVRILFTRGSFERGHVPDCDRMNEISSSSRWPPLSGGCTTPFMVHGTSIRLQGIFRTSENAIRDWAAGNVDVMHHDDDRMRRNTECGCSTHPEFIRNCRCLCMEAHPTALSPRFGRMTARVKRYWQNDRVISQPRPRVSFLFGADGRGSVGSPLRCGADTAAGIDG